MTIDQGIALVGILIAIAFGIVGLVVSKVIRRRKLIQSQKVGDGGSAIMSGRDTNIGKR